MPSSISGMNVSGALMIFFIALSLLLYDNALILGKSGEYPFCDTPPHAKSDFASRRFKEVF